MEIGGWRILTDPTFDPPGRTYGFGLGTPSKKTAGPAIAPEDLGPVDVILLSHDHHADNLDDRGRALLPRATTVVTTAAGQRRLGAGNGRGLLAGETATLTAADRPPLHVRATPCRHGPPLSRPITGAVIGFALTLGNADRVTLWMTGDTVLHRPVRELATTMEPDVLLMHLGSVQFPVTGPLRYSMNSADAVELVRLTAPRVAVPVHYEGWSHFHESPQHLEDALATAEPAVRDRVRWLVPGTPQDL
jgi:L-ascorbate metabolism protein UlaG (beta-lactamase superfamily)